MPAPLHRMNNEPTTQYKTLEIGTVMNIAKQEPPHKQGHNKFIRLFCNASLQVNDSFRFEVCLQLYNGKTWQEEISRNVFVHGRPSGFSVFDAVPFNSTAPNVFKCKSDEFFSCFHLEPTKVMFFDGYGGSFLLDVLNVPSWMTLYLGLSEKFIQEQMSKAFHLNQEATKQVLELCLFE